MKVLAVILVATAMADAKGSGPYLYQRPEGPAFMLPSEVVKPIPPTTTDLNQGSEASGSDFLQEYGPPNVQDQSLNLINQGLPEVTIEQTFESSAQNPGNSNEVTAEKVVEAKPEISTDSPTTPSQSSLNDNPPISAELPILDFEVKETTSSPTELATEITSQESSNIQSQENPEVSAGQSNQESIQSSVQESSSNPEKIPIGNAVPTSEDKVQEVQNIPDVIASLEKEVLTQTAVGELAPVPTLDPVLEGFLEYGPPGFVEYGPPKSDEEKSEKLQAIESNETRRRRFSPKLRLVRN